MLRRWLLILLAVLALTLPLMAQDALDLPADLYILQNDGQVQRFGVGAAGVTTITPEDAYIVDFGVDAAGERIAYRTESGLYILPIATAGEPVEIEGADAGVPYFRGAGDTIAWSPTGDAIAYTTLTGARVAFGIGAVNEFFDLTESPFLGLSWSPGGRFLAAQAEANVWWIYRRDGSTMALTSAIPSSVGTTWVSDSELVFAPAEGSLRLMNLDAANAQIVLLDDSIEYRLPYLNAEDALVFFSRDPAAEDGIPEGYGVLMRLRRGAQQVETIGQVPVALAGLRWTPDGSLLLAFQGGVIALFDPLTGLGFPLPVEGVVAYAWGSPVASPALAVSTLAPAAETTAVPSEAPLPAETPTTQPISTVTALVLSADSYFLSPDLRGVLQVWRMPSTGAPAGQFTGSGSSISEYAIAPDDGSVAYVTGGELWIQPFNRSQPYQLASVDSFAPTNLTFSPDGTQIAYGDESSGIWTVNVDGDEPLLALRHVNPGGSTADTRIYRRPQFSPDGNRLLLDVYSVGGVATGVLDLSTGTITESPASPDDARPNRSEWLADGRAFTYVDALSPLVVDAGFYAFDPLAIGTAPAQWVPFPASSTVRGVREVLPNRLRALLADGSDLAAPLRVVDFDLAAGSQTDVLTIDGLIAPRVSPDGRFIAGYQDVIEVDGTLLGTLLFVDLQNGRRFHLTLPEQSIFFQWRG